MEVAPENALAISCVLTRVEDVVVPDQIDEFVRHERALWVAHVQRQELTVNTLRGFEVDLLAVERLALTLHFEKDRAQIDLH